MDGGLQPTLHVGTANLPDHIPGDELILQSVVNKIIGADTSVQQALDLGGHAFGQASAQAGGDAGTALVAVQVEGYQHMFHRADVAAVAQPVLLGMAQVILLDLDASDGPFTGVGVGGVVEPLHAPQDGGQLVKALFLESFA